MSVRVSIPDEIAEKYEKRTGELADVLAKQLVQFSDIESVKPIVLTDVHRQQIEKLVGRNITTADELVNVVRRALDVSLDGLEIQLTPYLLDRLKTRCIGMPWDKFVSQTVKRLLEEFAGLR